MSVSDRVKILRKTLKKSQEALASDLGVSQGAISFIENGGGVSMDLYTKIEKKYNVNISWLINGTGEIFKTSPKNYSDNNTGETSQVAEGMGKIETKNTTMESLVQAFNKAMDFANKNNEELWQANREQREIIKQLALNSQVSGSSKASSG